MLTTWQIRDVYLLAAYQAQGDLEDEREEARSREKRLRQDIEVKKLQLLEMEEKLREASEELEKARRS